MVVFSLLVLGPSFFKLYNLIIHGYLGFFGLSGLRLFDFIFLGILLLGSADLIVGSYQAFRNNPLPSEKRRLLGVLGIMFDIMAVLPVIALFVIFVGMFLAFR